MRVEADGATEPLIRRENEELGDGAEEQTSRSDEDNDVELGWFIWILTFSAAVSGLLFGYDTGVISSTLVSINTDLSSAPLTTLYKSLITSSTSFFALLASPTAGHLSDTLGRKSLLLVADALFILGALWQAVTTTVWGMIIGRSIVGLAVGAASFVSPLYISELAPRRWRGRLVTVSTLFITGGQVVAYASGWGLAGLHGGWRWMVGLGAVPALLQAAFLVGLPETPRWLMSRGFKVRARAVLLRIYGKERERIVEDILKSVEHEIKEEQAARKAVGSAEDNDTDTVGIKSAGLKYTFKELTTIGGNRRALAIACLLQGSQQLSGFNSLMYFSATIFAMIGFSNPIATSLTIASTNFLFTLATFHYIDRIGRRRILLLSIPFMIVGLSLCALAFLSLHLPKKEAGTSALSHHPLHLFSTGATEETASSKGGPWPLLIVASMILYVAAYALGLGCVPWQQSELFPLSVRSLGSGIATATNWGCNTFVGLTFLPMMEWMSPTATFAVYAMVCAVAWALVWKVYPETADLGLEDVGELLKGGWGVEESLGRFNARKRRGWNVETRGDVHASE